MSFVQRLLTKLLPRAAAESMRAESQDWVMQCTNCGHERSYWEMGSIRWKAKGNPRLLRQCPACGQRGWHKVHRKSAAADGTTSRG